MGAIRTSSMSTASRGRRAGTIPRIALGAGLGLVSDARAVALSAGRQPRARATFPYSAYSGDLAAHYSTPTAISFTGTADDGTASIALPFGFNIFGHSYPAGSPLTVSTNGVLEFGDTSNSWSNTSLPTAVFSGPAVMPYWTDFDLTLTHDVIPLPGNDGEGAWWGVSGTTPDRVLAVGMERICSRHESKVTDHVHGRPARR